MLKISLSALPEHVHDYSGRAESALGAIFLCQLRLHLMVIVFSVADAFDGGYLPTVARQNRHQTLEAKRIKNLFAAFYL